MLIEAAGCPYSASGTAKANCGPLYDSFQTYGGWITNPLGTDTATGGALAARQSVHHGPPGGDRPVRLARPRHRPPGRRDGQLVRRRRRRDDGPLGAGRAPGDGRPADLPLLPRPQLELVVEDYFRAYVEDAAGVRTLVRQEVGAANTDLPAWKTATISMTPWAGQTVRIVFAAADLGRASTVEAAVDDVRISRP